MGADEGTREEMSLGGETHTGYGWGWGSKGGGDHKRLQIVSLDGGKGAPLIRSEENRKRKWSWEKILDLARGTWSWKLKLKREGGRRE